MSRISITTPICGVPHPGDVPWMSCEAVEFLRQNLKPHHLVFEWGSGASTVFFAKMCKVISIEHDVAWFRRSSVHSGGDVRLHRVERNRDGSLDYTSYVGAIDSFPEQHFDWIVVDGMERPKCIDKAVKHLKKGGHLVIDDAWREEYAEAQSRLALSVALDGKRTKIYRNST